jgi:ATP-dependent Clp protease protease subunit
MEEESMIARRMMPAPLKILFKDETKSRGPCEKRFVEIVVKEFNEETADEFEDKMAEAHANEQEFVVVRIHSPGGSVYALSRMLSAVESAKQSGMKVVTMCPGIAMSCGSILLSMGSKGYRFCSSHATILFHEISGGVKGTMTGMDNELSEYAFDNRNLFRKIARNAGLKDEDFYYKFVEGLHKDLFIHPSRALYLKIVDHMYLPRLKRNKDQTYSLDASGCKDPTRDELRVIIEKAEKENVVFKLDVLAGIKEPELLQEEEKEKKAESREAPKKPTQMVSSAAQQSGIAQTYYGKQESSRSLNVDPSSFY